MSLEKIGQFAAAIVVAAAIAGNLDRLNHWVMISTARLLYESRTSTWGSPIFWPETDYLSDKPKHKTKEVHYAKNKPESN